MKKVATKATPDTCPCGSGAYATCCGPLHQGETATSAVALMRSRYSAYVLKLEDYLRESWAPETRPQMLDLAQDNTQWLGLEIKRDAPAGDTATVEFIARYKVNGRAYRLHEISRFKYVEQRWLYIDGDIL